MTKIQYTLLHTGKYMVDFAQLKANRDRGLQQLSDQLNKLNNTRTTDDRYWYPNVDKAGNGYAVIRFLPAPPNEDMPFVRIFEHFFKGPKTGLWYAESSLTTIGLPDPLGEYNTKLWNSTTDEDSPLRKQVRDQKRKLNYISNIYVVNDTANPENNGKVFLFKYGKKIFDKINEAMNPQFADEKPLNPFDLWDGANFKVKIRNVEGYRNYDRSEFDSRSPLSSDDDELKAIWEKEYSLQEFLKPENFKSYDVLKRRLEEVLGISVDETPGSARQIVRHDIEEAPAPRIRAAEPKREPETTPPWDDEPATRRPEPQSQPQAEEEDDDLAYFRRLANGS